jgi:hypothetical protein
MQCFDISREVVSLACLIRAEERDVITQETINAVYKKWCARELSVLARLMSNEEKRAGCCASYFDNELRMCENWQLAEDVVSIIVNKLAIMRSRYGSLVDADCNGDHMTRRLTTLISVGTLYSMFVFIRGLMSSANPSARLSVAKFLCRRFIGLRDERSLQTCMELCRRRSETRPCTPSP